MSIPQTSGQIFDGKYELIEVLGQGGIGIVYRARQLEYDRIVALKVLQKDVSDDEEFRARFLREGRILNQLKHANLVTVYHLGLSTDNCLYLAMEFLEGKTLLSLLAVERFVKPDRAFKVIGAVSKYKIDGPAKSRISTSNYQRDQTSSDSLLHQNKRSKRSKKNCSLK